MARYMKYPEKMKYRDNTESEYNMLGLYTAFLYAYKTSVHDTDSLL